MDKGSREAVLEPIETMFFLEGDNIFFRGLDVGKLWEGYECPLFDAWMSGTVARYISSENMSINYDATVRAFILVKKDDKNKYVLLPYKYEERIFYDFGGTARWKKIERTRPTNGGHNNDSNVG